MPNTPDICAEYHAAIARGGWCRRPDRGLLEVAGGDRAPWLNNLVTNVVKTLSPGEGNYAFAVNLKGRVVFDLNILVLPDRLWLDVDARRAPAALGHLDRYLLNENVRLSDLTARCHRWGIIGPRAADVAGRLGLMNFTAMAQLQHAAGTAEIRLVRHDFAGLPGLEAIFVPSDESPAGSTGAGAAREGEPVVAAAIAESGFVELRPETLKILRMEAGLPAAVEDIDAEVVPPETGQVERGISYHKGCYLGQEVIERMRSHGILARRLVGLKVEGESAPPAGALLAASGSDVGRVTSTCWSEHLGGLLALGYVKSAHARPGVVLEVITPEGPRRAEIVSLPVRR
jgi:folate-binding protein YgfZ